MKEKILDFLRRKQDYVSGEEISQLLGVSRAAVWKHIKALREEGYAIDSVTRLGYRLREIPDLLLPEEIRHNLGTRKIGQHIIYFPVLDSTNNHAKALGMEGAPEGTIVLAEEQTGGRGRLGRNWCSPYGTGVYMSLLLRPQISPMEAARLTLLAAVAVAEGIREFTGIPVGIKWPNDILFDGKKVVGILTEMHAEMEKVNYVVVGIGINVNHELRQLPPELIGTATSLKEIAGQKISRKGLLQEILRRIEQRYEQWQHEGFLPILTKWKELSCILGSPVVMREGNRMWEGTALDVRESGALVLRLDDGTEKEFSVGEVSLRRR